MCVGYNRVILTDPYSGLGLGLGYVCRVQQSYSD